MIASNPGKMCCSLVCGVSTEIVDGVGYPASRSGVEIGSGDACTQEGGRDEADCMFTTKQSTFE
jgi:hypothetical protein